MLYVLLSLQYYVTTVDFDKSSSFVPYGDISQCYLGAFPTDPTGLWNMYYVIVVT